LTASENKVFEECNTIADLPLFIESHFATVKSNEGKNLFTILEPITEIGFSFEEIMKFAG